MMLRKVFSLVLLSVGSVYAQSQSEEVARLLAAQCGTCHKGEKAAGKLQLDTLEHAALGGASGPVIIPNASGKSTLLQRVTASDAALRMPPAGARLGATEVDLLKSWIDAGAAGLPVQA